MSLISTVEGFFINPSVPQLNKYNIVGYKGTDVPEEYIITILSARSAPGGDGPITVRAIIQDEFQMRTGSKWESFIPNVVTNPITQVADIISQFSIGSSLQNAVTSRRIWKGTEPLSMQLNMRFEEEYSSKTEVMEACEALQCMCLPGEDTRGLLIPPGPSPFKNDFIEVANKELIAIYIGTCLSFTNVIIKDVVVSFQTRMGVDGFFKAAKVTLFFELYEITTKKRLRSSKPSDSGVYSNLAVKSPQRYDSSYVSMDRASGYNPDGPSQNLLSAQQTILNLANKITGT